MHPVNIKARIDSISLTAPFIVLFLDDEVQVKREQKRVAMHEYYEKHGGGDHH